MSILSGFLRSLLTANRVVAAITILSGLAAFVTGVVGVLPLAWGNAALAVAGLLLKAVVALKFLEGSQKWDALTHGSPSFNADLTDVAGAPDLPVKPPAKRVRRAAA